MSGQALLQGQREGPTTTPESSKCQNLCSHAPGCPYPQQIPLCSSEGSFYSSDKEPSTFACVIGFCFSFYVLACPDEAELQSVCSWGGGGSQHFHTQTSSSSSRCRCVLILSHVTSPESLQSSIEQKVLCFFSVPPRPLRATTTWVYLVLHFLGHPFLVSTTSSGLYRTGIC